MNGEWQLTPPAKKRWRPSWRAWMMLAGLILFLLPSVTANTPTWVSDVGKATFFFGLGWGIVRATLIEMKTKPRRRACDLARNMDEAHRRAPH